MMALGILLIMAGIGALFLSFPRMLDDWKEWKQHKRKKLLLLLEVADILTGPVTGITSFVLLALLSIIAGGVLIYTHVR
jgi:hypothetical protein